MKLALAQMLVEGGRPEANLERANRWITEAAHRGAGVVLLPEALDFGWNHPSAREGAESIPEGRSCRALAKVAAQHGVMVCAGLVERDGAQLYNAAVLLDCQGQVLTQHRKIHELEIARDLYEVGTEVGPVVETEFGRVGVLICADGFAEGQWISRRLCDQGAELLLSPCAWAVPPGFDPATEVYGQIWRDNYEPVCRQRGVWIAGCSNVGLIEAGPWQGHSCIGNSLVFDPSGEEVVTGPHGVAEEALLLVEVDRKS